MELREAAAAAKQYAQSWFDDNLSRKYVSTINDSTEATNKAKKSKDELSKTTSQLGNNLLQTSTPSRTSPSPASAAR